MALKWCWSRFLFIFLSGSLALSGIKVVEAAELELGRQSDVTGWAVSVLADNDLNRMVVLLFVLVVVVVSI